MLKWHFDGPGGWFAYSQIGDDDAAFVYRIAVMEDGDFIVGESDKQLIATDWAPFATLKAAKDFCQQNEDRIVPAYQSASC